MKQISSSICQYALLHLMCQCHSYCMLLQGKAIITVVPYILQKVTFIQLQYIKNIDKLFHFINVSHWMNSKMTYSTINTIDNNVEYNLQIWCYCPLCNNPTLVFISSSKSNWIVCHYANKYQAVQTLVCSIINLHYHQTSNSHICAHLFTMKSTDIISLVGNSQRPAFSLSSNPQACEACIILNDSKGEI